MDKENLIEAIKEGLRVVVLSIIPILLSGLNTQTGGIMIDWKVVIIVGVVALLRFIDNLLHQYGKERTLELPQKEISVLEGGLTRF